MGNHFLIVTSEIDNETIHEESIHRSGLIEQLATRLNRKRDNQRLELTRNRLIIACVLAFASDPLTNPLREEIWMPCEDHRQPVPGRVITRWTPNDRSLPLRFQLLRPIVNIAAAIYGNPPGNDAIGVIEQERQGGWAQ